MTTPPADRIVHTRIVQQTSQLFIDNKQLTNLNFGAILPRRYKITKYSFFCTTTPKINNNISKEYHVHAVDRGLPKHRKAPQMTAKHKHKHNINIKRILWNQVK